MRRRGEEEKRLRDSHQPKNNFENHENAVPPDSP